MFNNEDRNEPVLNACQVHQRSNAMDFYAVAIASRAIGVWVFRISAIYIN